MKLFRTPCFLDHLNFVDALTLILCGVLVLSSCKNEKPKNDGWTGAKVESKNKESLSSENQKSKSNEGRKADGRKPQMILKFDAFNLHLDSMYLFEPPVQNKKDSILYLYPELGVWPAKHQFSLNLPKEYVIRVSQCIETAVTIMNEGPHCDLVNWKPFRSEAKILEANTGVYTIKDYSAEELQAYSKFSLDNLIEAARAECGDRWAELAKDCESPNEYPCAVAPSKFILKIEFKKRKWSKWQTREVHFMIPMGC